MARAHRPRKPTYAELEGLHTAAQSDAWVLGLALQAAVSDGLLYLAEVRYSDRLSADDVTVRASTYGLTRADGGIIVLCSTVMGQRPYVTAHYAERWLADMRRVYVEGAAGSGEEGYAMRQVMDALRYRLHQATAVERFPGNTDTPR